MSLIVPKIQPDELLGGYRGRIAAFNHLCTPQEVSSALGKHFPEAARWRNQSLTFIHAAAAANGLTPELIMDRYSCYPIYARVDKNVSRDLDSERVLSGLWSIALQVPGLRVRACSACVEEDLTTRSFSYWRRSHQVPGRFLCPEHGRPLWRTDPSALLGSGPDDAARRDRVFKDLVTARLAKNTFIAKAVSLLDMLLLVSKPLDRAAASMILRRRLSIGGTGPASEATVRSISKKLIEAFDPAWLRFAVPEVGKSGSGLSRIVAGALNPNAGPSCVSISILACMAFPTAAQALRALSQPGVSSGD